jgi:acetyltransferase
MKIVVTLAHHPTADRPDRLGMAELMSLLIACAAARLARSADEAIAAASAIGFPVALKIVSPDITHKAEAGGVVLGLPDGPAVRRATGAMFGRIATTHPAAVIHGVLVQSMAPAGPELFLSARRDEDRKPVISVDGALGPHGRTILNAAGVGATGHPGLDGLIGRVARLLVDRPDLVEIEIDPMIVGATGPLAVDARARIDGERPWS